MPSPRPNPPNPNPPALKLGTRASPLALAQADQARERLCAAHPGLKIMIIPITTGGDRAQHRPLAEIGGKALWTKELDSRLLAGDIDLAVHSLKDVETLRPATIILAAILPRADVRDVLLGAKSFAELPGGARIGTSAPRRAAQALYLRPDCQVVSFRGNVQTRLARLAAGEAEATLLARAGLDRLGSDLGTALDPEQWLPAAGQGAIGIECRAGDERTRALLEAIDHQPSHAAVLAERALLAALGGSCHSPVAVYTRAEGASLTLRAALLSLDGAKRVDASLTFAEVDREAPARLAARLLAQAGPAIRRHFDPPAR